MEIKKFNPANATAFGSMQIFDSRGNGLFSRRNFDPKGLGILPEIRKELTLQVRDTYELLLKLDVGVKYEKAGWDHAFTIDADNKRTKDLIGILNIRLPEVANSEINKLNASMNGQSYPGLTKAVQSLNSSNELEYKLETQPVQTIATANSLTDMLGSR